MTDDDLNLSDDELRTLTEARARAEKLVSDLRQRQAEIEAAPPDLPADKLEAGRMAMQRAIESAQRMLANLDEALKLVRGPLN